MTERLQVGGTPRREPVELRVVGWKYLLVFLAVLVGLGFWAGRASAQNVITFTAEATSGTETVTPVLTWDS